MDLIKIDENGNTINARDLWEYLESKQKYADWIKSRIEKYRFEKDIDYCSFPKIMKREIGATTITEYEITINMAKELAMIENNIRGQKIRRYFIEAENKLKEMANISSFDPSKLTRMQILEMAIDSERKVIEMTPKAAAFDKFIDAENCISMGEFAKSIGMGRNKLFKILRSIGILMSDNVPYQPFVDHGFFEVRFKPIHNNINVPVTLVTPRGVMYLDKKLIKVGAK